MKEFVQKFGSGLVLMLLAAGYPGQSLAVPGTVLFNDDFERNNINPWTQTNGSRAGILSGAQVSSSPTRGAFTRRNVVTVTSPTFSTAVPAADLQIWIRRGSDAISEDPDPGEDFVLEYRRSDNTWGNLNTYLGSGTDGQIYQDTFQIPPDGLHANFAVRVRQTGGSGVDWDYWHFDDVIVTERAAAPPLGVGSCDDFELGLSGNWSVNAGSGFAGTNNATSQSPFNSMFTNGGTVEVTSNIIDTTDPSFSNLTLWLQRGSDTISEDPDGNEDLVIEYFDDGGAWVALDTFAGNGTPGQIYNLSYTLPPEGRHSGFRLRFRQTGGSGATWDFWHVDDVCLDTQLLPDLVIDKSTQTISDPINNTTNPYAIPGAIVQYTISVTNQGAGVVDAGTFVLTDLIPAETALYIDDSGGPPMTFVDGAVSSGLSFNYASDVEFSDQPGGSPFGYIPTPGDIYDPTITAIRITFGGSMNAGGGGGDPSFELILQLRVE